ncbi:MAG: hypothetical protein R6U22_09925 [Desulfohalobiaceae bacterium]
MQLFPVPATGTRILAWLSLALLVLGSACSHQSVRHLDKQIWVPETEQTLQMKYMDFTYQAQKEKSKIRLQGRAQPRQESLPEWASWSRDIWLGAYLCDREGLVLAQDLKVLPAQAIDQDQGFAFEFSLEPQNMGSPGPVFITFGYRLVLTPEESEPQGQDAEEKVFFASESALARF